MVKPTSVKYSNSKRGKIRYHKKPFANGKYVDGYCDLDSKLIVVNSTVSHKRQAEILLHELVHQSFQPLAAPPEEKPDVEEMIVETISNNMVVLWTKNSIVFEWIHKGLVEK